MTVSPRSTSAWSLIGLRYPAKANRPATSSARPGRAVALATITRVAARSISNGAGPDVAVVGVGGVVVVVAVGGVVVVVGGVVVVVVGGVVVVAVGGVVGISGETRVVADATEVEG